MELPVFKEVETDPSIRLSIQSKFETLLSSKDQRKVELYGGPQLKKREVKLLEKQHQVLKAYY